MRQKSTGYWKWKAMAKVSVVLPLYNADIRCLDDCIASIQAQTLTDFECIFVNDGSPTRECIDFAAARTSMDARFVLVEKSNGGLASARNFGFKHSKGSFITFVDQDDLLHPQRLELAVGTMEARGADVSECRVLRTEFGERFRKEAYLRYERDEVLNSVNLLNGEEILKWYLDQKMNITVWSHVYLRRVIEDGLLPECVWGSDDLAYNIVNASRIKSLVKIVQPLYLWRRNPKATTGRVPFAYAKGVVQAIEYILGYYKNLPCPCGLMDSLKDYLYRTFIDVMRDCLQIERDEMEQIDFVGLSVKANMLLGGELGVKAELDDQFWVRSLLDGDFTSAATFAKIAMKLHDRKRKKIQIKRFVKKILGRG